MVNEEGGVQVQHIGLEGVSAWSPWSTDILEFLRIYYEVETPGQTGRSMYVPGHLIDDVLAAESELQVNDNIVADLNARFRLSNISGSSAEQQVGLPAEVRAAAQRMLGPDPTLDETVKEQIARHLIVPNKYETQPKVKPVVRTIWDRLLEE